MNEPKEILSRGTKPENPVRDLNEPHPCVPDKIWFKVKPLDDIQVLKRDLKWYQDECMRLEKEVNDLETELFDKEVEIEQMLDQIEDLHNKIVAQP